MSNLVRVGTILIGTLVFAACAAGSPSASRPLPSAAASVATTASPPGSPVVTARPATPVPTVAPSAPGVPTSFTSPIYGYSLTVPAGWTIINATAAWDGKGAPFHDVPEADQFVGPAKASAWFFGAPTTKDLAGQVKESIAANVAEHSSTCPAIPEVNDPIKIGAEAGTLLGYNCGILINTAITVHKGKSYVFGFRDTDVHAANDPADRAVFLELLKSVRFPG